MYDRFVDEVFDELADEFVVTPRPDQYIRWVQLSLRRLLGVKLKASGEDSPAYREAVKQFQQNNGLPPVGKVGPRTQNALIKANAGNRHYVSWVQRALNKVGFGPLTVSGRFDDNATRPAVLDFQGRNGGLEEDGWVGVKTELILIQRSGLLPPDRPSGYPETPKPKPPKPTDVTDAQLYNKLKILWEWLDEDAVAPHPTVKCLVAKLLNDATDDAVYSPLAYMNTRLGEKDILDLSYSARRKLKASIKARRERDVPMTPEMMNDAVEGIMWDLVMGVKSLKYIDCYDARTRPLRRFIDDQTKRSDSLYSCSIIRGIMEDLKDDWSRSYGGCAG